MPTTTCAIPGTNVLFARCFGHITPEDIIGWNVEAQVAVQEDGRLTTVVDLSEITGTDMTFEDINAVYGKLVRHYQPRQQKLHLVLYAPDDLAFGMTRILQSLTGMTDHVEVQIFRDSASLKTSLPAIKQSLEELRNITISRSPTCSA